MPMKQPPKRPTNGPCPFCEQYPCECEEAADENVYDKGKTATVKEPKPKRKRKGKSQ